MSFGGQHNQYSPYYQQIGVEQDGSRAGNSTGNTYQAAPYPPLSAYQSRPPQPAVQNTSASLGFYADQGYGTLNTTGTPATYDARNGYRNDPPSVDTRNLGNLAYASSLSRPTTSKTQSYSQGNTGQYGQNKVEPAFRAENRTTSGLGTDPSRRLSPTTTQSISRNNNPVTGRSSPAQPQYSITNPSHQPHLQYTPPQQGPDEARLRGGQEDNQADRNGSTPNSAPTLASVLDPSLQPTEHQKLGAQGQPQRQLHKGSPRVSRSNGVNSPTQTSRQVGQLADFRPQARSPQFNNVEAAAATIQDRKGSDSTTKDQMELEMKQMIEKMRDYKAKDPSLFSQIWEQVKKGQAPPASSTKSAAPLSASPTVTNAQFNSPILSDNYAESEASTASSFPPDFDRGRFPYQRRCRGGLIQNAYKTTKSHHKMSVSVSEQPSDLRQDTTASSAEQAPTVDSQSTTVSLKTPAPIITSQTPAASFAGAAPAINQTPPTPSVPVAQMYPSNPNNSDDTDRRLLVAMQKFHQTIPLHTPPPAQSLKPSNNTYKPAVSRPTPDSASTPVRNAQLNTKPFQGKTHWPEHKKQALAEAAVTFLKWNPANAGKSISATEVHELLNQNPSYTEMCETLTYRGFVVERGHFARFLLNAVPNMGESLSNASAAQVIPSPGNQHTIKPSFQGPQINRPLIGLQQVYVSGKMTPSPHAVSKPPTKEDKARKRNFSEIVDLTQVLPEDEDTGSRQDFRNEKKIQNVVIDPAKMTISRKEGCTQVTNHLATQEVRNQSITRVHILKEQVAEPMNKRRDARRCSNYDPKTIARDILISSGKHPIMAPLNCHLDVLREKFDSVTHDTDLSTFKWDVVDPRERWSEKRARPSTFADIMNENDDHDGGNDEDVLNLVTNSVGKAGPSRRGRPKKKRSGQTAISNVSSLGPDGSLHFDRTNSGTKGPATGYFKLPKEAQDTTSVALNHQAVKSTEQFQSPTQLNSINSAHPDDPSIFQSFRFTPVATSKVSFPTGTAKTPQDPSSQELTKPGARCLRCRTQHRHCDSQKPCSRCRAAGVEGSNCIFVESTDGDSTPDSNPRRVGRPPGAKNKKPRPVKGIPKGLKAPSVLIPERLSTSSLGNSSPLGKQSPPVQQSPFGKQSLANVPPRRSSEPRSAISQTSSIAVVISQPSPHVNTREQQYQSKDFVGVKGNRPVYRSYKCKWDHCPAELHNLETFRKHVHKYRQGVETPIPCKMPECAFPDGDNGQAWLVFEDIKTWDRHIEQKHVRIIARSQGELLTDGL